MNSDDRQEREQLEAATARAHESGVALDSETSALRSGFLSLGQALDKAAAEYDEAALLGRLQASCAEENRIKLPDDSRSSTILWQLLLSGALAASALFAIVRIVASWPAGEVVVAPAAPADSQVAVLQEAQGSDPEQDGWEQADAWDDPLDEEIVAAQDSLADLAGQPVGIDGALSNVNQTLEALADDLAGESL